MKWMKKTLAAGLVLALILSLSATTGYEYCRWTASVNGKCNKALAKAFSAINEIHQISKRSL